MIRLWGIIRKNNKMRQNIVLELPGEALEDVLLEGVQALGLTGRAGAGRQRCHFKPRMAIEQRGKPLSNHARCP